MDRSWGREEPCSRVSEWQKPGRSVACSVSRGRDRRVESRSERDQDRGDQLVGQSADWGSATRGNDVHVCGRQALQGEFTAFAIGFAWAGDGGTRKQQIESSQDEHPRAVREIGQSLGDAVRRGIRRRENRSVSHMKPVLYCRV